MRSRLRIALLVLLVSLCGCAELHESWEACAAAAEYVHLGDSDALCRQFSGKMLEAQMGLWRDYAELWQATPRPFAERRGMGRRESRFLRSCKRVQVRRV